MKVQPACWAESTVWLRQPSKFEAVQTNKWLRQFCNFAASIWLSIAQPLLALHLFCCGDQSDVEVYFYILSDEQGYVLEMVSHLKRESEFLHHIKSILFLLVPSLCFNFVCQPNGKFMTFPKSCKADRRPIVCCSDRQVCNYVITFLSTTFKHLHGKWQTIVWINIVHEKKKMPNK